MAKRTIKKTWIMRLFFWHRYIGIFIAFFVVLLSITGILLNHTEAFSLDSRYISSSFLLRFYGIESAELKSSYAVNNKEEIQWVSEFGDALFLQNKRLHCDPPLKGAIKTDSLLVVANNKQLCLFMPNGDLVDRLSLPQNDQQPLIQIQRIALIENQLILASHHHFYQTDTAFSHLQVLDDASIIDSDRLAWATVQPLDQKIHQNLQQQYHGQGLSWERVIQDFHSGRIFGSIGVYFMDIVALLFIFLCVSGVTVWKRNRLQQKRRRKG